MVDQWSRVFLICVAVFFFLFDHTLEQQLVSRQDRLALLEIRSSLGLRAREWPIKSNPCTSWLGINCTSGRVTAINISGFRRTKRGNLNPQFSVDALRNLTFLSSFNASKFPLPGPIPDWFGLQLPSLQVLDLRSCIINGTIPSTLGNLSSIVELYLSDNNLTGIIPSSLGQLFGLSVLDLARNRLTGSIPATFVALGNLTSLDMSLNFLSEEIPPGFGNLSGLQFLNLSWNSLSSPIPSEIGFLSSLVELNLGFNSLSGSLPLNLGGLRSLRRVILSRNSFSGEIPDILWLMPSLQFLDLSVNNFTGLLPNVTPTANASVAVFNVSQNLLYGNLPPVIRRLDFLDLSGNYFEGPIPVYASVNASLSRNCLRDVANQRNAADCSSFYAGRDLPFDNFGRPDINPPAPASKSEKKSHKSIILASVLGGVGIIATLVLIIVMLVVCKRKRVPTNQTGRGVGPTPAGGSPPPGGPLINSNLGDVFTYQLILQATGELNDGNLIKHGHSGDLYSGKLEDGIPVIIKRIDFQSSVKRESYKLEMAVFSKVSHPRLVPLLGHCLENENEKFLVYKHMVNGDLSTSLFKKTDPDDDSLQSLDWITRLKIAIGAAEGLCYLHHECTPPLVHRDIQASSILLDDKYEVRLGSLSSVCVQESDAHQSRITRLLRVPQSSEQGSSGTPNALCAYDVYCFGKVLLELVTGKLGISSSTDTTMKEWLEAMIPYISIYDKELVTNIIDPSLIIDEDLLEEVWAMAIVARSCLNPKPTRRPLMRYILKALENPLKVVREENTNSARLRTTSSRGSWNATIFGSWRQSSMDIAATPASTSRKLVEGATSSKQSATAWSQGSGQNGDGNGNSSSTRRHSKDIFPEPLDEQDLERAHEY